MFELLNEKEKDRVLMIKNTGRRNRFMEKYGRFCDLVLLGCLFIVTSLPVVTLGASCAALYYALSKCYNHDEGYLFKSYWKEWKGNMKQGIILTLLTAAYLGVGIYDVYLVNRLVEAGNAPAIVSVLILVYFIPAILILPWMFAYMARFNDTIGHILGNCIKIGISNPGKTLLTDLLLLLTVAVTVIMPPALPFIAAPIGLLWVKLTEPVLLEIARNTEGFDPDAWYNE